MAKYGITLRSQKRKENVVQLRITITELLNEGRLKYGTKLATELVKFADRMEADVKRAKKVEQTLGENSGTKDGRHVADREPRADHKKTAEYIRRFADTAELHNVQRGLIQISDVHKSIERQMLPKQPKPEVLHDEDLQPEEKWDYRRRKSVLYDEYDTERKRNPYSADLD